MRSFFTSRTFSLFSKSHSPMYSPLANVNVLPLITLLYFMVRMSAISRYDASSSHLTQYFATLFTKHHSKDTMAFICICRSNKLFQNNIIQERILVCSGIITNRTSSCISPVELELNLKNPHRIALSVVSIIASLPVYRISSKLFKACLHYEHRKCVSNSC